MVTSGVCSHKLWSKQWASFISPELHAAITKVSEVVFFFASELFSFTTQKSVTLSFFLFPSLLIPAKVTLSFPITVVAAD